MASIPSIAAAATTAATALSSLVLVTPQVTGYQPQISTYSPTPQLAQVQALLFHYEGENTATLESDITDHYSESNSAIADQIALRPEVITVNGFIGELNDVAPGILGTLQSIATRLTSIQGYVPTVSATALLAYNEALFAYQTAIDIGNSAISAWNTVANNQPPGESVIGSSGITSTQPGQNKQQTMFQQFYGYWRERALFTIQTPWAIFQNMAIKSLRAIQSAETNTITNFEVSFKMIRYTASLAAPDSAVNYQGQLKYQGASALNLGTNTPPVSQETFASMVS